jgi:hypothetical protein
MNEEINDDDFELNNTLKDLKNKEVFKVPDRYFENFQKNILAEAKKEKQTNNIFSLYKPILAVAAILTVVFFVYYISKNNPSDSSMTSEKLGKELAKIDNTSKEDYLISHVDEIDNDLLNTNTNTKNINIYINDNESNNAILDNLLDETSETEINNLDI